MNTVESTINMKNKTAQLFPLAVILLFFGFFFYYFFNLNRFHLLYLEQSQLFLFQDKYWANLLSKPAGVSHYLAAFVTQFFVSPLVAALVVTAIGVTLFALSYSLFSKFGFVAPIAALIWPLLHLAILNPVQNHIALSVGFMLSLLSVLLFFALKESRWQIWLAATGLPFLIFACGITGFLATIIMTGHYLIQRKFFPALVIITVSTLTPLLLAKFYYLYPLKSVYAAPFQFPVTTELLIAVIAGTLIFSIIIWASPFSSNYFSPTHPKRIIILNTIAFITLISVVAGIVRFSYDPKTEQILAIDHAAQEGNWSKVLTLSEKYPGNNRLVLYYTNMALYQTGQLGNRMFDFRQQGTQGLWLNWERDGVAPLFGAEIYYHLNYINEAYRWAFEAMMAKGPSPRLLKRLAVTSIINGDYQVADKYLNILDQTLFYDDWAKEKRKLTHSPELASNDVEIGQKRKMKIHHDFIAIENTKDIGLIPLLQSQPNNRMAFEYLMASFLLNKDLEHFTEYIGRLKDFGYREIPRHYEEALIAWMLTTKKEMTPEGYAIRQSTLDNFSRYYDLLKQNGRNPEKAKQMLANPFGNTFWYYLNFSNSSKN